MQAKSAGLARIHMRTKYCYRFEKTVMNTLYYSIVSLVRGQQKLDRGHKWPQGLHLATPGLTRHPDNLGNFFSSGFRR